MLRKILEKCMTSQKTKYIVTVVLRHVKGSVEFKVVG